MKTGEEKFDDEIRQKLRYSEAAPPNEFFDRIVPPANGKKRFLWLWLSAVALLVITATMVKLNDSGYIGNGAQLKNSDIAPDADAQKLNSPGISENIVESDNVNSITATAVDDKVIAPGNEENNTSYKGSVNNSKSVLEFNNNNTGYPEENKITSGKHTGRLKNKDKSFQQGFAGNAGIKKYSDPSYNYDLLYIPVPALPYNASETMKPQIRIPQTIELKDKSDNISKYSLELSFSKSFGKSTMKLNTKDSIAERLLNAKGISGNSSRGYSLGLKLFYKLNKNVSIGAGLNYAERKQDFEFNFKEFYNQLLVDTIQYYILFPFSPPQQVTEYDTTLVQLNRDHLITHHLKYKSISLSAELAYKIPAGIFLIEPRIGVIADIYSQISGTTNFNTAYAETSGENHYKKNMQARFKGGINVIYPAGSRMDIFINCDYQYSLTELHTNVPFYTERINQISAGAGIIYKFFNHQAAKTGTTRSDK